MRPWQIKDALRVPERVITVTPQHTAADAWELMLANGIHHLVVVGNDNCLIGVVADRDLFEKAATGAGGALDPRVTVAAVMTAVGAALTETTELRDVLAAMRTHGVSALPVVRDGELTGIVTESDLLRVVERLFAREEPAESAAEQATERGMIMMSNPLVQNAMQLLAEAGI